MNIKTHILSLAALIGLTLNAQFLGVTQATWTYGRPDPAQNYSGSGRCVSFRDLADHLDVRYAVTPGTFSNPRPQLGWEPEGVVYQWTLEPGWVYINKVGSSTRYGFPLYQYGYTIYDCVMIEFPTYNAIVQVNGLAGSFYAAHALVFPWNGVFSGTVMFEGAYDLEEDFRFRPCRLSNSQ